MPREGFVFADSNYPGAQRPVAFDPEELVVHANYLGKTGTGKSNAMEYVFLQAIEQGHGGCYIDPTPDAIPDLLCRIPDERIDDVIIIDPTDKKYACGINVFEAGQEPTLQADFLMSIIAGLYPGDKGIYVSNYMHARIQALAEAPDTTLVDLPAFLKDPAFRESIIDQVTDEEVLRVWKEFDRLKPAQQEERVAPALHRVRPLLLRPPVRNILGQSKHTINFRNIIREDKILLASLPKGLIGDDTCFFIGGIIVARLFQEFQGIPRGLRRPWYINIDEAPNFLNMPVSMDTILAESRKFGASLSLANQQDSQWGASRPAIHANTRNKAVFSVSIDDSVGIAKQLGVTVEDVLGLGKFEAIVRTPDGSPATVKTRELPWPSIEPGRVRARSNELHATPLVEVKAEISARYKNSQGVTRPPIGRRETPA